MKKTMLAIGALVVVSQAAAHTYIVGLFLTTLLIIVVGVFVYRQH
jgi:hypothetical protein